MAARFATNRPASVLQHAARVSEDFATLLRRIQNSLVNVFAHHLTLTFLGQYQFLVTLIQYSLSLIASSANGIQYYCCRTGTTCKRDPYVFTTDSCAIKADSEGHRIGHPGSLQLFVSLEHRDCLSRQSLTLIVVRLVLASLV